MLTCPVLGDAISSKPLLPAGYPANGLRLGADTVESCMVVAQTRFLTLTPYMDPAQ